MAPFFYRLVFKMCIFSISLAAWETNEDLVNFRVEAMQKEQLVVLGANTTLVCKISCSPSVSINQVYWLKNVSSGIQPVSLANPLSSQSYFLLHDGRESVDSRVKIYAAILNMPKTTHLDLGLYLCRAELEGVSVRQAQISLNQAPSVPDLKPQRPFLTCCLDEGISKDCLFLCKDLPSKQSNQLMTQQCHEELPKIGQCTVTENVAQIDLMAANLHCLQYTQEVLDCDTEGSRNLPMAPFDLEVKGRRMASRVTLTWQGAKGEIDGQVYQVYFRQQKDDNSDEDNDVTGIGWHRLTTRTSEVKLESLMSRKTYKVVVVAANAFMASNPSRPIFV